ncbi:MAG: PatB family C-S lyase [Bacteroidales bacterium]|nr:PatB family C-S lyase [Bacteroidales bacterium]
MSTYDFEKELERRGTACVKHDLLEPNFGASDLLPMWVADMDIASPDFVLDDLRKRLEHPVLGYTFGSASYYDAILQWLEKHYAIRTQRETLHFIPGIVAGIAFCLQSFTREGDAVTVMTPVYPPFLSLPKHGHRELRHSKLYIENGRFHIDFADLDRQLQGSKLLILSNPHNPGGTVWTREELQQIAALCAKHKVTVISDEIHADLTLPGYRHTSYATVSDEAAAHSVTFMAPSKTFNIAGLASSVAYVPNASLRQTLYDYIDGYELANGNVFAYVGAESAFRKGEEWLKQLLAFLQRNIDYATERLHKELPEVRVIKPEASFLLWMDFSAMGIPHEELKERFIHKAHIALNDGTTFGGSDYEGCFRMNVGCPRRTLDDGLERIFSVLR